VQGFQAGLRDANKFKSLHLRIQNIERRFANLSLEDFTGKDSRVKEKLASNLPNTK